MRRAIAVIADALALMLAAAVVFIIVTGGGVYFVRGQRVSATGVDNPLLALAVIAAIRYAALRLQPLFGVRRWPLIAVEMRARTAIARLHTLAGTIPPRAAVLSIAATVAVATLIKVVLAWAHPGFFSGDDVEVHEMSVGLLWNAAWPIWDLRNASFPLGVIYPMQKLFAVAGASDPAALVFAGRLAVASVSSLTIVLVWRAGLRLWPSARGWAVVAALFFAATQLHVAFGSSELPRPVATVLVVAAFVLLLKPVGRRVVAAAVLLGIAAALRFSEGMFLAPALAMLLWEKRWAAAVVLAAITASSAVSVVAATDAWYWGEPLHSLKAAVDYTLVHRLSSRGYQHPFWYVLNVFAWLNPAIVVLAAIGLTAARRASDVWFWLPVLLLSLLPHKEARYMIPVVPFACLAAARGLQIAAARIAADGRTDRRIWQPVALLGIIAVGFAHDAGHWRLPRSNADVAFARQLDAALVPGQRVVLEQAWRAGGRLYLHPRDVVDLDPDRLGDLQYVWQTIPPEAPIVLDSRSTSRHGLEAALHARGYQRHALAVTGSRYELWTTRR